MIAPTIPREEIYTPDTCRPFPAVESCVTLSAVVVETGDQLKPLDALRMLVTCAVGDGNLALNTNPMPGGRIEPRQVENFRKIGAVARPVWPNRSTAPAAGRLSLGMEGAKVQHHCDQFRRRKAAR